MEGRVRKGGGREKNRRGRGGIERRGGEIRCSGIGTRITCCVINVFKTVED